MKRYTLILLFLLLSCIMTGCERSPEDTQNQAKAYKIYYLNSSLTTLLPQEYTTETTDKDQLVQELMDQFVTAPANVDCQVALSSQVRFQKYKVEDMVLYLYFNDNYSMMKPTREILCRTALVKTLTQIDGIDFVSIYAGEQPLLNTDGIPVGMLAASDFIDSIGNINSFEKTELTLFFTDETGEKLLQEKREVVHDINTSREKLIVEQLIKGPSQKGLYPTLPKDVKLLNVSVNENICYLNFDSEFLNNTLNVKEYIPIYSIVNSLSEMSNISKIQITVNGSQDVMFRDSISLNTLFERNLDIGGMEN